MSLGSYDWLKLADHGSFSGWRRRHDRSPAVLNTMSMTRSSWSSPSLRPVGFSSAIEKVRRDLACVRRMSLRVSDWTMEGLGATTPNCLSLHTLPYMSSQTNIS